MRGKKEPCLFQFGFLSQGKIWLFCFFTGRLLVGIISFCNPTAVWKDLEMHQIPFLNFFFCFEVFGKRARLGSKCGSQREPSGVDEAAASWAAANKKGIIFLQLSGSPIKHYCQVKMSCSALLLALRPIASTVAACTRGNAGTQRVFGDTQVHLQNSFTSL